MLGACQQSIFQINQYIILIKLMHYKKTINLIAIRHGVLNVWIIFDEKIEKITIYKMIFKTYNTIAAIKREVESRLIINLI